MATLNYPIASADVETLAACPACATADEATDVAEVRDAGGAAFLTTAVCRRCGLIYRRRRPRLSWFVDMWARRDDAQARTGGPPFHPEVEQTRYRRYAETARIMRRYSFGPRVLDVGCGPATGLAAFAEAGFTATGLEPDASRARFAAAAEVEIVESTIERFAADTSRRFDAATCQHSLEHFHDPGQVLRLIADLLEPEGTAYIEVPDFDQSVSDWNDALYLAHLTNFTGVTLAKMGCAAGFDVAGLERPAADETGKTHLAMIFRKSAAPSRRMIHPPPDHAETVARIYRQGLPASPRGPVARFVVPMINDISLSWKGNPQRVDRTVRENFHGRTTRYDPNADVFLVGEPEPAASKTQPNAD
jgi:SAM-dependent methyltransferase